MLDEHIPYRLSHLDGLIWASQVRLARREPSRVALQFDGQTALSMKSIRQVTNPLMEIGILYCRNLLEFLGIKLDQTNQLVRAPRSGKSRADDFTIEALGLNPVPVTKLLSVFSDPSVGEKAVIATLVSANKGIAHFTSGTAARAYVPDSLLCASALIQLIEELVYQQLRKEIPEYRIWTQPSVI
jgi:hypothetical protein